MADGHDISAHPDYGEPLRLHGLRSLQFKASLLIVVLIIMVSMTMMALGLDATRNAMLENESSRTHEWAVSLATSAAEEVAGGDRVALQRTANNITRMPGVAFVAFAGPRGRLLATAESCAGLLDAIDPAHPQPDAPITSECLDRPRLKHNARLGISYMDVVVPVRQFTSEGPGATAQPRLIGYLRFATNITSLQAKLQLVARDLLRVTLAVMLLVVPCSLLATRRVVAPLHQLALVAHAVARGAMDVRASVHSRDEIGELARVFNFMADHVAQTQSELIELNKDLEHRVAERTHDLEEQAARDPLTGLYNRRHFGEVISREFSAAERYGPDLTCLMFDVDHFKVINDRYGHRTGDKVLIALAQAISAELRSSDVAARFGGDEFILLLPQTAADQASILADRIVNRFADDVAASVPGVNATLSIGVASLRTTRARSSEALIHEADVALYAAKEGGRNRTMQAVGTA